MENQQDILKTVIDGLVYIPTKDMIVKPLEDEYVEKEIIKPVETGKKDENGYDIRLPSGYQWQDENNHPEVGDVVAYPRKASIDFDLFKDSQLVNPYNVVAFVKGEKYFKD